jgi:hypothetical protein
MPVWKGDHQPTFTISHKMDKVTFFPHMELPNFKEPEKFSEIA